MKPLIAIFLVLLIVVSFVIIPVEKLDKIIQILRYILLIINELSRK